jgi:long-chain acyl-CoA synthetase
MSIDTLADLLHSRANTDPRHIAMRTKDSGGRWVDRTWAQLRDRADAISTGILTAVELADNDVIGLLGATSEDWLACDFAGLSVGLQTVPIYASLLPEEIGYCHTDTGIKLVIVDDKAQLEKVRAMRGGFTFFEKAYKASDISLKHIVVIDPTGIDAADDWESLADLEVRGRERLAEFADERVRRREAATPDQVATYTYTSGTTGPPKAVIQTHDNHLATARAVESAHVMSDHMREGGLFLFLPLAHSFGRLIQFSSAFLDLPLVISSVPTLVADATSARPGFFPAAPRVYEKMKSKIESAVAGAPPIRQKLFHWAVNTGKETIPYRSTGRALPPLLALKHRVADKIVLSKLRAKLGLDRADALLSGSAPLDAEVQSFFLAMGLNLLEGYGLTETCPALTCNRPGQIKVGTVGIALPNVEIKIAVTDQASGRGEILAKGPNITQGYLNRPKATAEAFDDDGWFHTGDEGMEDSDGFITITGRIKELIKTSGGKYVAPAKIEGRIKMLPIIQEAVVIGDTRNFCVALISIDPEELEEWTKQRGLPSSTAQDSTQVKAAVDAHLAEINSGLASFESIKYTSILPEPLSIENGLLTASLKVKRKIVEGRYADMVDAMYQNKK